MCPELEALLCLPDEEEAFQRLRAMRAERMRATLRTRHDELVRDAQAGRIRGLIARVRDACAEASEPSHVAHILDETIAPLHHAAIAVRFPTVQRTVLRAAYPTTPAFEWKAHLSALEAALATDLAA